MINIAQPLKKLYVKALFVVALLLFSVSAMSFIAPTVDVEAAEQKIPIMDGDQFINLKANVVVDSNGKYRGIRDCEWKRDVGTVTEPPNITKNSACSGTFLKGMSIGDTYNNEKVMLNAEKEGASEVSIQGVAIVCFGDRNFALNTASSSCYAQANNGNTKVLSQDFVKARGECSAKGVSIQNCPGLENQIKLISGPLRNGTSVLNAKNTPEQTAALDAANKKAVELSKDGVNCKASLDANNKAVYSCNKAGKAVGPQGEELSAECKKNANEGIVLFRIGANDKLTGCLSKDEAAKVAAASVNQQINNTPSTDTQKSSGDDIGAILLDLFAKIILIVLWIISSILSVILLLMMNVLGAFLQINPASRSFLSVAVEPWRIVLSIANLVTLFSFLYTGFNYILGVKNKKPIGDFFVNIIVVVLTINFTIFGAAAFVNIAQGIGDTFVGAYSSVAEPGKSYGEVLLANFTSGVGEVSILRCGGAEKELKLKGAGCKESAGKTTNNMFSTLFGGKVGDAQAAMVGEAAYILIIGYAIFVIWQALLIVLIRVVALWLLMVTSPFALAAFFSPVPQLKKLANQWVEYFLNYTMIYPVIVLGFVLVGQVSKSFGAAARANIEAGGIGAVQAAGEAGAFQKILPLILVGLVSVGALNLLVAFLKTFKNVTDGLWNGAKTLAKGVGGAGALLARGAGGTIGALAQNKVNKTSTEIGKLKGLQSNRDKELAAARKITDAGERNKEIKRIQQQYKQKDGKSIESNIEKLEKYKEGKQKLVNSARGLQYLPERIQSISQLPKNAWKNYSKQREADRAKGKAEFDTARELYARQNGAGGLFDSADSAYSGMGPEEIQQNVDKDPDWIKNQIAAQGSRASAKVYDSKYKMDKDTALETIKRNSKKSGGDWTKLSSKDQERTTQALQQTLGTEQYAQEIAGIDGAVGLAQYAYKNRLLNDETEAVLDKLPIFQSDAVDQRTLGQLAASSKGDADQIPGYAMTPEFITAFSEAKKAAGQGKEGDQYLTEKLGYEGGLARVHLLKEKARGDDAAEAEGELYQSARNGLYEELSTKAVDQTRLAGRLHEEVKSGADPGSISDDKIAAIVNQSQAESFGVSSESEMRAALAGDAAMMERVKNSSMGQLVDKKALSPEQKTTLLRDALESSVNSFEANKEFYSRKVADATIQQYKVAEKFESETMLQSKAEKSLEDAMGKMRRGQSVTASDFQDLAVHQTASAGRKNIESQFGTQLGSQKEDLMRDYNKLIAAQVEGNPTKTADLKAAIISKYGSTQTAAGGYTVSQFIDADMTSMSSNIAAEKAAIATKYASYLGADGKPNGGIIDELGEKKTKLAAEVKAAKKTRKDEMSDFGGIANQLLANGVL